jgi:hypothetical protein
MQYVFIINYLSFFVYFLTRVFTKVVALNPDPPKPNPTHRIKDLMYVVVLKKLCNKKLVTKISVLCIQNTAMFAKLVSLGF